MIERTVIVKSAETKDTKDGKRQFLSAVLADDSGKENTQSIFDPAIRTMVQGAYNSGAPLLIHMEKEGNFWNIKDATLDIAPREAPASKETKTYSPHNKDDEILMAVAFKGAIELETHLVPGAEPNVTRVLRTTTELLTGLLLLRPKREGK